MQITNRDQLGRTIQALAETHALISKEQRYSPDLRKWDYLASLERHAAKLVGMISEYRIGGASHPVKTETRIPAGDFLAAEISNRR